MRSNHGQLLPVVCGMDAELMNFVLGLERANGTGYEASRWLLREIQGLPLDAHRNTGSCLCSNCRTWRRDVHWDADLPAGDAGRGESGRYQAQDWGRRYLAGNGGCAYIDLDYLELCIPEVRSAFDHLACWHAMLRIAQQALAAANAKLPPGQRIQLHASNSDGQGHSCGSHLSFLLPRRVYDDLFDRRLHHLLFLAAYESSSIVFTGAGKVGSENGAPPVDFQLSQRADFFETLFGPQTTHRRPLVNTRDESLCGRSWRAEEAWCQDMARLHCIFFDVGLCHVAHVLKVGVMQIILAMIAAGAVDTRLILDDPLDAVLLWSHDASLCARARLVSGRQVTAVELQKLFLGAARRFAATGALCGIVPRYETVLDLWEDTLAKLAARDLPALAPRLDWVLKLSMLQEVQRRRPHLGWHSPEIKHLDFVYSSLDPSAGLYWQYEKSDLVERLVSASEVERFVAEPPTDTRAWARAHLLRRANEAVDDVDWDRVRIWTESCWTIPRTLSLANPLAFTRDETEAIFAAGAGLDETLDALEALTLPHLDSRQDGVRAQALEGERHDA